jgi:hypothetical protein
MLLARNRRCGVYACALASVETLRVQNTHDSLVPSFCRPLPDREVPPDEERTGTRDVLSVSLTLMWLLDAHTTRQCLSKCMSLGTCCMHPAARQSTQILCLLPYAAQSVPQG